MPEEAGRAERSQCRLTLAKVMEKEGRTIERNFRLNAVLRKFGKANGWRSGVVLELKLAVRGVLHLPGTGLHSNPCLVQSLSRSSLWKAWLQCKFSGRFQSTAAGTVSEMYSVRVLRGTVKRRDFMATAFILYFPFKNIFSNFSFLLILLFSTHLLSFFKIFLLKHR